MESLYRIVALLADGRFHSGQELGSALGISRAAVWKQLKALDALGVELFSVRGRGYALASPVELLDRAKIRGQLDTVGRKSLPELEIHPQIESTNRYLMGRVAAGLRPGHACLTERQTQGRGRRGRNWVSPFAANVYLSLYWRFPFSPSALAGLSLAAGVSAAMALEDAGVGDVSLKWPNDLLWRERKLGGILLEMAGEASGPCHVVIGVGINVAMPAAAGAGIDQPWVDLATIQPGAVPSRNRVAGLLLNHLLRAVQQYEARGVSPFIDQWQTRDATAGQPVELRLPDRAVTGIARGVDGQGALLLEHAGTVEPFSSGEVSLRLRP
ncbi:MAG: bifunctional biotin--[acetyl-CoA-carboxylase] ligase/biotin operon repressor BirA [Gammaproteobacteria bacterium]